jgi:SAM-dependent methyltransferase
MIRQFLRRQTPDGLRSSLQHVWGEIKTLRKHRKGIRQVRKLSGQQHLRLHIGCGPKIKKAWINIDLSPQADITLDMREPLPFLENSCSIIYSEHFLEHLDYPGHANSFLRECYRVLEPGGVFSVGDRIPSGLSQNTVGREPKAILELQRNVGIQNGAKRKWNTSIIIFAKMMSTGLHMISKHSLRL